MKELKPYRTLHGLQRTLDNGGRFYNLWTSAGDEVVSRAELAKAAGVYSASSQAFLFLEMAQCELTSEEQDQIRGLLEVDVRRQFNRMRPKVWLPSQVESEGKAGQSAIVTGYPRFVEDRTQFSGFIMVPIMAGSVMTFAMIPIMDRFDVYEVFDDRRMRKPNSMIATVRGKKLNHAGPIRFGGTLKKLEFKDKTEHPHTLFLETAYYTKLPEE